MFAPQKSVNLTFFQRFVDYNWPTRKRTFRHILSFLSQLSVGPSLCRSRSSRASPEVSFRYIPKLPKLALTDQEATRQGETRERDVSALQKIPKFRRRRVTSEKTEFWQISFRDTSTRKVSTENNLLSWRYRESNILLSSLPHFRQFQNLILYFTM